MLNRFRWLVAFALLPLSLATAQAPASWSLVGSASVADLAVNANGAMWAVQFDQTPGWDKPILKLNGNAFVAQPRTAMRIAVDPQGNPWAVSTSGELANLPAGASQWTVASLKATDVSVGADGSVWAIGMDQSIHRLTNGVWKQVSGAAVRIAVDPRGNAWVVNGAGQIWRFDGNGFQIVNGTARDIAIAPDGSVFIVGMKLVPGGFEILQWNGNGWTTIPGAGGVVVAANQKLYIGLHSTDGTTRLYATDYVRANTQSQPTTILIQGQGGIEVGAAPSAPSAATAPADKPLDIRGIALPAPAQPIEGSLICPIIGEHYQLTKGCALVGEPALYLGKAPSQSCPSGQFGDPQNGGECWTCPVDYVRNVSPVSSKDACWKPIGETLSKATNVGKLGCKSGFFNDPIYGCFQCPAGYYRTLDNVTWSTACAKAITGPFSFATNGGKPVTGCAAPSFGDPIDGGTCWTCPATYRRTLEPVNGDRACAHTYDTQYSVATQKSGCSMTQSRVGYGVPFYDPRNGGECWTCPVPLIRAGGSPVNTTSRGALAACNAGGNTNRVIWQLTQYPEPGPYVFMSGLIKLAFENPKLVDAFVTKRAGGDPAKKRAIWASMIADPGSSAEVKALLFAALLTAAKQPNPTPEAKMSLDLFEKYARSRRIFVAEEAKRMYTAWQGVDGYNSWQAARQSLGSGAMAGMSLSGVMGSSAYDYKSYAWAGASPDSAGLEFVVAASDLAASEPMQVGVVLNNNNMPSGPGNYIGVVAVALDKGLDHVKDVGEESAKAATSAMGRVAAGKLLAFADRFAIGATLVASAIDLGMTVADYVEKEKQAAEYNTIVSEAEEPVSVKEMLDSNDDDDRRSLMLFWALATSPYSANAKLGEGKVSTASLCQVDEWTKLQCAQAKGVIATAANIAAARAVLGN